VSDGPFRTKTVTWVAIIATASFAVAMALVIFGPDFAAPGKPYEPTGYSVSAVGYAGLVATLEDLHVPVVLSRYDSTGRARPTGVLVVAEPRVNRDDPSNDLESLIDKSDFTLLVLPKRLPVPASDHEGWVSFAEVADVGIPEAVLRDAGIDANVRRIQPTAVQPIQSRIGAVPTFDEAEPVQVVEGPGLWPLVTTRDGGVILAGLDRKPGLFILADPDPLSNAGFHLGDNVTFFLRVLNHVRDGYESVVFDETVHGFATQPTIWRELFAFPLVLIPIHLVLLMGLALWAGMDRFGPPLPTKPPLGAGTPFLVDRTAALLRYGRTSRHALPRYLDVAIRDARSTLDAPSHLEQDALDAWLDRVAEHRGAQDRVSGLREAVDSTRRQPHEILVVAARIHRWKREILHGPQ
jgi:hypothetical protein